MAARQIREDIRLNAIEQFWAGQDRSLNRTSGDAFYRRKAQEHASILLEKDAGKSVLDIGCGAGELLEHLMPLAKVDVALDYSESMLAAARMRLAAVPGIEWVRADVFQYLPETPIAVWMTTGAINQYLDAGSLRRILDIFVSNASAQSLYLFDCIDPLRYRLLRRGLSYRPEHAAPPSRGRRLKDFVRRLDVAARFALGAYSRDVQYLGSPGMGYGQLPRFWLRECTNRRLPVEIVSSRYYEYRYHVRIAKGG